MSVIARIRSLLPKPVHAVASAIVRPVRRLVQSKRNAELGFWRGIRRTEGELDNAWYERIMLRMAGETDQAFLRGKVVADFGCGPCGSLAWVCDATAIGIDVLVPEYCAAFPDDIRSHAMIYVTSTESLIPLPDSSVDVMYTINALDHVGDLQSICEELCRVLKPGGRLLGSFNLNEPPCVTEPQMLTEEVLDRCLLHRFECRSKRFGTYRPAPAYCEMFEDRASSYERGKPGYMWFDGTMRADA